ncbi:uncharacterized protein EI90DRAFT_3118183 [Cantharellus anzutake]|uniref:uncharacterized protein n=1 Tax=Cantharellus anzutake TaxID=1750568 RepID=UPI001908D03E|nr:uncharacterized protein EI90DRAFT_3118183 [Cantharellus anzutake]KAF8339097.1 hypothetical protein EI90DRAFT_3118183 [Cantharellus anzutake]
MSRIEVDDLVASFSCQHIGQEQIDLANLQAQLRHSLPAYNPAAMTASTPSPLQTPYNHPYHSQQPPQHSGVAIHISSHHYSSPNAGTAVTHTTPVSTPTQTLTLNARDQLSTAQSSPFHPSLGGRSRSTSRTRGAAPAAGVRNRSGSIMNMGSISQSDWDEMDEVEEELGNGDAMDGEYDTCEAQQHQQQLPHPQSYYNHQQQHHYIPSTPNPSFTRLTSAHLQSTPTSHQSAFATSDPFYLATLKSTQATTASSATSFLRPAIGFGSQFPTSASSRAPAF